jgi:5-methylcytosine-specific restriction protein B
VLAVGTVVAPGYVWRPERSEYKHTVTVSWDESYGRTLPEPVKRWAVTTVADVPGTLWRKITGPRETVLGSVATSGPGPHGDSALPPAAVDPQLQAVADALERKGQVVLFGPPGTGKTYTALRFALWWLASDRSDVDPLVEYGSAAFRQAVASLSAAGLDAAAWWMVANPAEWSWQRMFADGQVTFRAGRIAKNYTRIRPGDVVFCYEASPVRRIVGFAQVTDVDPHRVEPVGLRALSQVPNGPTWFDMSQDPQLAGSEPVANRSQGTLFALTGQEAARLLELTGATDETMSAALGAVRQVGQLTLVPFHPSYGYEDFIEGFKPVPAPGGGLNLRLLDGVFKRVCRAALAEPNRRHLVLIDEINRGNIPKILGELITLLEVDKRGLAARLPQSGESFTVPPNVHLLGTMNTADRSIRLLDAALRRRFAFLELAPDAEVLEGAYVGKPHLAELLTGLNARIRAELGRERQVGHAFLLRDSQPVASEEDFAAVIRGEVVPLLQEYAYDDYAMLTRPLGQRAIDATRRRLRELTDMDLVDALYNEFQAAPFDAALP